MTKPGSLWEFRRANTALAALEHYFDTRERFYDTDEEGRSGVYMHELDKAREDAIRALASLGENDG